MKIAIVEDEAVHSQLLSSYIKTWGESHQKSVSLLPFENASQFLFCWEDEVFDVIFLDIQMPGMNGMELARKVRTRDHQVHIVFTTGITDFLQEGYEVDALNYLLKPLRKEKVFSCLDKAVSKCQTERFLLIHAENDIRRIPLSSVNYIEAKGHNTVLGLAYQAPLITNDSLSNLELQLENSDFIKCHRSYLCRVGAIHRIDKDLIFFDDKTSIPVSRRMYQAVNQAFIRYYRNIHI